MSTMRAAAHSTTVPEQENRTFASKESALSMKRPPSATRGAFGDITNSSASAEPAFKKQTSTSTLASRPQRTSMAAPLAPRVAEQPAVASVGPAEAAPAEKLTQDPSDMAASPVIPVGHAPALLRSPGIDGDDFADAQKVAHYAKDIYEHFQRTEARDLPSATYMSRQTDINAKMRAILIDWLVDVHLKFKLLPETLFLTVNLIDRFLSQKSVPRSKLQLVGVTAMLIASKYEEIYAPEVRDFVYICAKAYTKEEILKMERLILATLNFGLTTPTAFPFIKRFVKASDATEQTQQLANYFVELALVDYAMIGFLPSILSASVVYLAHLFQGFEDPWSAVMQHYTTYTEADLQPCARQLLTLVRNVDTAKLVAVKNKYTQPRFGSVAAIPPTVSLDI